MVNKIKFYELKKHLSEKKVTLVAVSKLKPASDLIEMYALGQRDFGENYVQELVDKQAQLPADINWHFIGHLQSNKVKYIASFVHLIQGVDSEKLLKEINKQAAKNNRTINVLLQVHIAQEETKFGFDENELLGLDLNQYPNIKVMGLMGMASFTEDKTQVKTEFAFLKKLFDKFNVINPINILSMGMSNDYDIAIEKGSNMVRIGSLLFGKRS